MTVVKNPTKLANEVDARGQSRQVYKDKHASSCWKVHTGNDVDGIVQLFERLCFYKDVWKQHPVAPRETPGLFMGWLVEP